VGETKLRPDVETDRLTGWGAGQLWSGGAGAVSVGRLYLRLGNDMATGIGGYRPAVFVSPMIICEKQSLLRGEISRHEFSYSAYFARLEHSENLRVFTHLAALDVPTETGKANTGAGGLQCRMPNFPILHFQDEYLAIGRVAIFYISCS